MSWYFAPTRRTVAGLARVPAEIVAPTMGHRDTRMVERVYGRLSPEEIDGLLSAHFADCRVLSLGSG
jgi:hypothetical protein